MMHSHIAAGVILGWLCGVLGDADANTVTVLQRHSLPSSSIEAAFKAWIHINNKHYDVNSSEYNYRLSNFEASLRHIAAHDVKALNGGDPGYTLGLTAFADWSDDEFREAYLSHNPVSNDEGDDDGPPDPSPVDPAQYWNLEVPSQVDWRQAGIVGPVKDQHVNGSKCGCCWAFATIAITEMVNAHYTGKMTTLSEQMLIDCDRSSDPKYYDAGCEGGGYPTGVHWIIEHGITSDEVYPYIAQDGTCDREKAEKVYVTVDEIHKLLPDNETFMAQVISKTPIVTGVCCGPFLIEWRLYTGGIFDPGNCVKPVDHAVPIVGLGSEDGKDYWLIKNSWGAHWGENGYLRVLRNTGDRGTFGLAHKPAVVYKFTDNPPAPGKVDAAGLLAGIEERPAVS